MTDQRPVTPAPAPLEAYAQQFDALFDKLNQRDGFRRYLEGVLLPTERHKSLTGLANTEPVVSAQHPRAQALQWVLSEFTWSERAVQERRLQLLLADPLTAPTAQGCWRLMNMATARREITPRMWAGTTCRTWARSTTASSRSPAGGRMNACSPPWTSIDVLQRHGVGRHTNHRVH